jgi:hypothetical protein
MLMSEIEKREIEEWLAMCKEEALKIDPQTAKLHWEYGELSDPYGVRGVREEEYCIGQLYFARNPDSGIWVSFHDLTEETAKALWARIEAVDFDFDDDLPL